MDTGLRRYDKEYNMSQALEGIRVIDFTHDQAGPSRTQVMPDLTWISTGTIPPLLLLRPPPQCSIYTI